MVYTAHVRHRPDERFRRPETGQMDGTDATRFVHQRRQQLHLVRFQLAVYRYVRAPPSCSRQLVPTVSAGFYRVNYDKSNWDRLVSLLNVTNSTVHVRNRAQLIDDAFNLARAGMLDYATALDVSTYLRNEDDYVPWYTAVDCLSYVVERMRRSAEGYQYIKVHDEFVPRTVAADVTREGFFIFFFNLSKRDLFSVSRNECRDRSRALNVTFSRHIRTSSKRIHIHNTWFHTRAVRRIYRLVVENHIFIIIFCYVCVTLTLTPTHYIITIKRLHRC